LSVDAIVVGGGIAGLAAADRLAAAGLAVTLFEASDRLGGNIRTADFAGRPLDLGAEVLVTADPAAIDLCRDLSLDEELVLPAVRGAHVWTGERLRPLPSDVLSRPPGAIGELLRARLLSPRGALRCGLDLVIPSHAPAGDVAVGAIVRRRLGGEVLDRLVEPLLGGIHAGRCDELSAQMVTPRFLTALATGKGLIRGLRAARAEGAGSAAFVGMRGGLQTLVSALGQRARSSGALMRTGVPIRALCMAGDGRLSLRTAHAEMLDAQVCVLAAPARQSGAILASSVPQAASVLHGITHNRAVVVALAYPADALAHLPPGTGFVTGGDERLVRACTWASAKWQHLAGDPAIVKAFVGRAGSPPPDVGDGTLGTLVHDELTDALGLRRAPVESQVEHFDAAIPQYAVGHRSRVARIDAALPGNVAVAGASYRGVGVSACIRSGLEAADRVLIHLGAGPQSTLKLGATAA
jgi:protoporphyrinogen/coproporphyrinogen III oxidase